MLAKILNKMIQDLGELDIPATEKNMDIMGAHIRMLKKLRDMCGQTAEESEKHDENQD